MRGIEKALERRSRETDTATWTHPRRRPSSTPKTSAVYPQETVEDTPQVDLNFRALAHAGYLPPTQAIEEQLAEEFRVLKRPVLNNAGYGNSPKIKDGNLVAVTSAIPKEGKTFITLNLALSIAIERDVTVLLADVDLVARSLTRLLGLDTSTGLTDVLSDNQLKVSDVILKTNIPKLRLIPAGRVHQHTTELLASDKMRNIINELSKRYSDRLILFDTAPILTTSMMSVLDMLVGQVLVVVEEGSTPPDAIQEAIAVLDQNKAIGLVLNKSRHTFKREYGPYPMAY